MSKLRTYRDPLDPGRIAHTKDQWVSNDTYTEMVQKTVVACTDVIITIADDSAIYLGKRVVYPHRAIWCLGGRLSFNDETLEHSASRCIHLETGMQIDRERFTALPVTHLYSWVKVAQGDFCGKNLVVTFNLEVTKEELAAMAAGLHPKEYDREFGLQRFTLERLADEHAHPALVDSFNDIFTK